MPDACQDACSGLTCADYAHETCELARLVGCLCAGCDCGRLLLGNATRAASPAAPPLPESADGGGGGGLALWSAAAASVVAVAGGAAVAGLRAAKADDRAAVASLCAVAVVVVVIVGQGLIAFDVEFDYAVAADTVFDGYDFWGGARTSGFWGRTYVGMGFGAADGTDVGFGVGAYMKYPLRRRPPPPRPRRPPRGPAGRRDALAGEPPEAGPRALARPGLGPRQEDVGLAQVAASLSRTRFRASTATPPTTRPRRPPPRPSPRPSRSASPRPPLC